MNRIKNDNLRVATITYHKAYNYGSALQAYALNHYLNKHGINAEVINYHSSAQDDLYKMFETPKSVMGLARNLQSLLEYKNLKTHNKRFDQFVKEYICLTESEYTEKSDLSELNDIYTHFICGSDQIWNPNCADFTKAYLLDFVSNKSKCFSYAASMAIEKLPDEWENPFVDALKEFKMLSVRENQGKEYIQKLLDRDVEVVPDPVLLLTEEEWLNISAPTNIKGKYILCYFIGDVSGMREFAKHMRKETGLQLVVIYKNIRDMLYRNKKYYSCGPREFISLIKNCEYVCTNSFHAVLFSLMFKKNFWAFVDLNAGSAKSRLESILNLTGMQDRILCKNKLLPQTILEDIDYSHIGDILTMLSDNGKNFLKKCLEE